MSLYSELGRRNVFRVALAYLAASWLLIQVVETLFPIFDLPDQWVRWLVVLLAIGFLVTVVVAWFYELTPEGVMSADDAAAAGHTRSAAFGRHIDFIIIGMLIIAVGWLLYERSGDHGISERSIAVLPFANQSPNPEEVWFSDGISGEVLNLLAGVEGLRVTARTSSFQFRGSGADIQAIGSELGVSTVLEGSVRRADDSLRISAQLIATADGFQLWSGSYERTIDDVFAVQDEIANAIVAELNAILGVGSERVAGSRINTATSAYELYMQGTYHFNRLFAPGQDNTNIDAPRIALEYFDDALEIDPDFALAWAGKARSLGSLALTEQVEWEVATGQIRDAVDRAMELGPHLAEVQFVRAQAHVLYRQDDASRLPFIDRAIELNPNYADAHAERSTVLASLGRFRESFAAAESAAAIDPLNGVAVELDMLARFFQGETDGIYDRLLSASRLWPDANGLVMEAHLSFELGHLDRIVDYQARARQIPGFGVEPGNWVASAPRHFGDAYLTLGMIDRAREWMSNPDMAGRYDDAIHMVEGQFDEAIEFLRIELEEGRDKALFSYRWYPDIIASLTEAYLYAGRYAELVAFADGLSPNSTVVWLPRNNVSNPPWSELAYTFAMFETGRTDKATEWLDSIDGQMQHRMDEGLVLPNHFYELARIRAMQGRSEEALIALQRAIELGWRRWYFELDPVLAPLRSLDGYAELKSDYDADIERLRAAVLEGFGSAD